MARLTDYGIVLMTRFVRHPYHATRNARELAVETHLPTPTVSKILKILARGGLLMAHRGAKGGFSLARPAEAITVADIIRALEGPIAITECSDHSAGRCELELLCPVGSNWQRINRAIEGALENIRLSEMAHPFPAAFPGLASRPRPAEAPAGA